VHTAHNERFSAALTCGGLVKQSELYQRHSRMQLALSAEFARLAGIYSRQGCLSTSGACLLHPYPQQTTVTLAFFALSLLLTLAINTKHLRQSSVTSHCIPSKRHPINTGQRLLLSFTTLSYEATYLGYIFLSTLENNKQPRGITVITCHSNALHIPNLSCPPPNKSPGQVNRKPPT
jgi:hypothetical protein